MLLRSRNRLEAIPTTSTSPKPTEKSLKANYRPENEFSPENKCREMKVAVTRQANKMLKKMNKSDLQYLVVRLRAEIKRLHKVHMQLTFRNLRLLFSF